MPGEIRDGRRHGAWWCAWSFSLAREACEYLPSNERDARDPLLKGARRGACGRALMTCTSTKNPDGTLVVFSPAPMPVNPTRGILRAYRPAGGAGGPGLGLVGAVWDDLGVTAHVNVSVCVG
jgi:hypothetical protein